MLWSEKKLSSTPIKLERIAFQGGFNTETPPLEMPSGFAIDANNFEIAINGGYRRIAGYERFDGQLKPSEQFFFTLPADVTGSWTLGDTITGVTSTETATVIGETSEGFIIAQASGTFTDTEDLQISAASVGTCEGAQYVGGATTVAEEADFANKAADVYRADILAVPGSGSVLGVNLYNGTKYAFRNNAGSTAAVMHESTASGWSEVDLGRELHFDAGLAAGMNVGDTLDGVTSGASGVITGIAVRTGSFAGNDAVGLVTFASVSGGAFQNNEQLDISATPVATADGVDTAITLDVDGRYQFENYNFTGAEGTLKMYGCDGVNRAFEFDGSTFIPIETGMTTDTPVFITAHRYHLFLSFGASVQHSGPGTPFAWTPVLGASELALGDTVTGFYPQVGGLSASTAGGSGALLITARNRTFTLYGASVSDWILVEAEHEAGAIAYTMDKIGYTYMLDDRGVRSFGSTDSFGNFEQATLTRYIQSWLSPKRTSATDSHISKELNQYRLFFSDGTGLYITIDNNKIIGMMPITLGHTLTCSVSGEEADGTEGIYFGASDGFVYQMEKGTSFDGDDIDYKLQLAWDHMKTPTIKKRFHKCALEIKGTSYVNFNFGYLLDYLSTVTSQPDSSQVLSEFTSFMWDDFVWDDFVWDGRTLAPSTIKLKGSAENISLLISGASQILSAFTVTGAIIHYSMRKRERS